MRINIPGTRRIYGAWVIALAVGWLVGGCKSGSNQDNPVTGSVGGQLPGMPQVVTPAQAAKASTGDSLGKTVEDKLPDGRLRRVHYINNVPLAEIVYNLNGQPEHVTYFGSGGLPLTVYEVGPDGQSLWVTGWYEGTKNIQRREEYDGHGSLTRFTVFWPNGNSKIITEVGVPTPAGPVLRVREWAETGQMTKLSQKDVRGRYEGRQTDWDATGRVKFDAEYHAGVVQVDYVKEEIDARNPATKPLRPY